MIDTSDGMIGVKCPTIILIFTYKSNFTECGGHAVAQLVDALQ